MTPKELDQWVKLARHQCETLRGQRDPQGPWLLFRALEIVEELRARIARADEALDDLVRDEGHRYERYAIRVSEILRGDKRP